MKHFLHDLTHMHIDLHNQKLPGTRIQFCCPKNWAYFFTRKKAVWFVEIDGFIYNMGLLTTEKSEKTVALFANVENKSDLAQFVEEMGGVKI